MLNDKKLLAILILLSVYVLGVRPIYSKLPFMIFELKNLDKAIAEQEFLLNEREKIKKVYPTLLEIIKENESLFFQENIPISSAMSSIQSYLKQISSKSGVKLINISWGSPVKGKEYTTLFLSFSGRGFPSQFETFLRSMYSFKKLVRFESLSVYASPYANELSFSGIIKCFKLNKGEEIEKK